MAALTSAALAHRAMTAGRRSTSPLNTCRASSYSGCPCVINVPVKPSMTAAVVSVMSPPSECAACRPARMGRTLPGSAEGPPPQQETESGDTGAAERVGSAQGPGGQSPAQSAGDGRERGERREAADADADEHDGG